MGGLYIYMLSDIVRRNK